MRYATSIVVEYLSLGKPSELEFKKVIYLYHKGYIPDVSVFKANKYFAQLPEQKQIELGNEIMNHSITETDINFVLQRNAKYLSTSHLRRTPCFDTI